jgi:tripartite-type tricarboxylate transporter receptor subunit TctC
LFPNFKLVIARAFAPVTQVSSVPFLLYLHPALPPRTAAEFVAYAKVRPD